MNIIDRTKAEVNARNELRRASSLPALSLTETDDDRVTLVGPEKLAEMVVDSGLVNWLIRKTS
jgi:hypothetical protein